LLIGIIAQVKESFRMNLSDQQIKDSSVKAKYRCSRQSNIFIQICPPSQSSRDPEDFHAAIRRFSQRKKRQMGVSEMDVETGKCMNFFDKFRKWRKGASNC
jgi:hypothetical protein